MTDQIRIMIACYLVVCRGYKTIPWINSMRPLVKRNVSLPFVLAGPARDRQQSVALHAPGNGRAAGISYIPRIIGVDEVQGRELPELQGVPYLFHVAGFSQTIAGLYRLRAIRERPSCRYGSLF